MEMPSTLELALLGLLRGKPQSGYDLRKTFATTAMRHYSDSPGSIYPALRRLESRRLIRMTDPARDRSGDGRRRQEFALTETGRTTLVTWLELEVSREDIMYRIAELMLRFAFMDGNIPRTDTIRFLDEFARELAAHVEEMRGKFEQMSGKTPSLHTGLLAFESGIRGMETQLAWAREARARLAEKLQ